MTADIPTAELSKAVALKLGWVWQRKIRTEECDTFGHPYEVDEWRTPDGHRRTGSFLSPENALSLMEREEWLGTWLLCRPWGDDDEWCIRKEGVGGPTECTGAHGATAAEAICRKFLKIGEAAP